jgi:transposase
LFRDSLDKDYPAIASRAKWEGAEIHWGDETGLRSDDVRCRGFAPKGEMRWNIFEGAMNAALLIDFLRRLIKSAEKKVFLILDNLRVHHSKPVKAWLAQHQDEIEVFYLPSYSPELNPDKMANADLKQAVISKAPARTKKQLIKATVSHLRSVQKQLEPIRLYFQHGPVRYAA